MRRVIFIFAVMAAGLVSAHAKETATATLKGPDGESLGVAELMQTPNGVLLKAKLENLPPGVHAFHIHQTGACEPDFKAAGGHYAPMGHEHGFLVDGGPHAGDMPNIHVPESGALTLEILNAHVSLAENAVSTVFDQDGSAFIIHAAADDYRSQPAGDAGDRIACGVIE